MLASINPLGERARGNRFSLTAAAYVAGSVAGGAATGGVAGAAGWLLSVLWEGRPAAAILAAAGVSSVAAGLLEWRGRAALSGPSRQVNEDWLHTYRGWVYGAGFGLQLGAAVVTRITTLAVPLMLVLAALAASPAAGAAAGVVFGTARALPLLLIATARDPNQLRAIHRRVANRAATSRRWSAAVIVALGLLLLAGLVPEVLRA